MTTIAVAVKGQEIAIAADGRRSIDSYSYFPEGIAAPINKINKVGESYVATCGSASWPITLESYFASLDAPPPLRNESEIFQAFGRMHEAVRQDYFHCPDTDPDTSAFEGSGMSALIANPYGIFAVSSRRSVVRFDKYWAEGSGEEVALGAMYATYDNPKATAKDIVTVAVHAGAVFDKSSSPPFTIHTLQRKQHETEKTDT